jgi:starvation-inducible DNA-binding protein
MKFAWGRFTDSLVLCKLRTSNRTTIVPNMAKKKQSKVPRADSATLRPSSKRSVADRTGLARRRGAPLRTPSDLPADATRDIGAALNGVLADVFALYLKTKNFHWHMSGPHFRDYHMLLDDQSDELFAMTDVIAERVRKVGATTLRSIGHIARTQRVLDNDAEYVTPTDMLSELREDNRMLTAALRQAHGVCDEHNDIASASLIENWIDEAEQRTWFLFESTARTS